MVELKLSPSKIEKYRQWNEGEYKRDYADADVITKESLIDSITGKEKWTPRAEFGTAFHAVMRYGAEKYRQENGVYLVHDSDMPGPFAVEYSEIELADEYHKQNQKLNWEIWHTYTHVLDGYYKILMRMRFDAMLGQILKEHKTTSRGDADYDFFNRSNQWRIYLISTGAPQITYERFLYKEPAPLAEGKSRRAGARDKREVTHNSFHFFPSDDMEAYVNKNIRGLIRFCELNVDEKGESLMKYIIKQE